MGLVGSDDRVSLMIHIVYIVLISIVKFVHFPDEIISFIS